MEIPGNLKCEGLRMEPSEAENLVEEIRNKKWTGYLRVDFRNFRFLLLFEEGIPTYGFRVIEDQFFSFSDLKNRVCSLKGGNMRFYETSSCAIQTILDLKFGEQIYGSLHTSFCDLKGLSQTLEQKGFTGSVEIDLSSLHCFVVMEKGVPREVVFAGRGESEEERGKEKKEREKKIEETIEFICSKAASENGIIKVLERRNPPTVPSPDPEEVFVWSYPRRLKLEFAFGQLGKEFEKLLDQEMTVSEILETLCVDFVEIAEMYTYLSAKGYIATGKKE